MLKSYWASWFERSSDLVGPDTKTFLQLLLESVHSWKTDTQKHLQRSRASPSLSMHSLHLAAIEGMSFWKEGYAATAWRTFGCQFSKDSLPVSIFRRIGSARVQTCSCGLSSGEYLGHGSTVIPAALNALLAAGACKSGSPSKSMWNFSKPGKHLFNQRP